MESEENLYGKTGKSKNQTEKRLASPHGAGDDAESAYGGRMILSALATAASFLPYLAIYFIIQEIVGAYPDFDTLDVSKVLGYGTLALGGVLLNVLLYTASVALSHIAAYGTLYQCKMDYVAHITKLPLGYHLKMGSGKLRKIMDDNIESLEGFIAHDLPNMISSFVAPIVMLV